MFGDGQHVLSSSHGNGGTDNATNLYTDSDGYVQRQQIDNDGGRGLFSSGYPEATETQHIRLQSPPQRLNHRNRNLHQNQQYNTAAGT